MIIDAHTFVHPDKDGFGARYNATLESLLRNLDESPVDKAVLFPIAADTPYIKRTSNEFVHQCCERHPEQLIGFASVNPRESPNAADELEHDVRAYRMQGLKLHPRFMGFAADDPCVIPVVRRAAELGIPVAIDSYLWKPTPLNMQLPFRIDNLCKQIPQAKVIMCHGGGFRFLDALAMVKANDNLYVDLSLSLTYFRGTPFEDQFMFVLKSMGANRLIYGSDHPQESLATCYANARTILTDHGFTEVEQERIFGGTILSLLPGVP